MDLHAKSKDEKTLALMASSVNCLWQPDSGANNSEVSIFRAPKHGDTNRCEISISVARPLSSVIITSSGRTCEVLEPSARLNASPSYVSTIRGCEAEHEGVYRIKVDVQVRLSGLILLAVLSRCLPHKLLDTKQQRSTTPTTVSIFSSCVGTLCCKDQEHSPSHAVHERERNLLLALSGDC